MSDSQGPPAKRARLDGDADAAHHGAAVDAPGSPVDDMDDDFYDNTPVKPAPAPVAVANATGSASAASLSVTAAALGPVSFQLPGLGRPSQSGAGSDAPAPAEASEDGELSDSDTFYHEQRAVVPAAVGHVRPQSASPQPDAPPGEVAPVPAPEESDGDGDDLALALAITNGLADQDGKAEFLQAAEANKNNKDAEWQLDSDASSSASSSDSSSDSSEDEDGSDEGELLDPEQTVRLLMAESADEPATKAKVKTLNEVEEQYEKPDIAVTEATAITELGKVESIVDNIVVVKARVSGDLQVLESGSALCLQDRTVIGKISEQIGRVEEPRYALGFNDAEEITTLGIAKDTPIYYVDDHSTFVFTEPLRAQKHTDASNLHDEETNDVEFSDDEKEAEYKREQKMKKRARVDDDDEPKIQKPIPTGPKGHVDVPNYYQPVEYQGGGLKYSDDEDEDLGMYKPLARPDHFEQIVGHGAPLEDRSHVRRGMMRGRGPWGDRGRGFRGRGGFGGRGDFGGGQNDRGSQGGGRGDLGGGRGDRSSHSAPGNQANRGGAQGGRTDRTCYACGLVGHQKRECPTLKPQLSDRGRQPQDTHQRGGQFQDHQSVASASPARHQDRGQSQQSSQPQHSPPAKTKNKNRKQRLREKKEKEREHQQQQQQQQQRQQQQQEQQHQQRQQPQPHVSPVPTGPSNANSYANNSTAGWPQQYSHSPQPTVAYAPPPPAPVAAPYAAPMPYAQTPAPAPAPALAPVQQAVPQQQANWAAWAQWLQVVQTMQQQQQPQAAGPPAPPTQAQGQVQAQYGYPATYQAYGQPQPPAAQPPQQADQSAQSLHDILRALGGGGQR